MNQTDRVSSGFFALSTLSKPSRRESVHYCLKEAILEAVKRHDFDTAAALRDLQEVLTDDYKPQATPADELRAAAGV